MSRDRTTTNAPPRSRLGRRVSDVLGELPAQVWAPRRREGVSESADVSDRRRNPDRRRVLQGAQAELCGLLPSDDLAESGALDGRDGYASARAEFPRLAVSARTRLYGPVGVPYEDTDCVDERLPRLKPEDFEQAPCGCAACIQAGVSEKPQVRDFYTGAWLHGYDLKRLHEAREKFWREWGDFKKKLDTL